MRRQRKRKSSIVRPRPRYAVELSITYKGLDPYKDGAIRQALGEWDMGSGFLFSKRERDFCAEVPPDRLKLVLRKLRPIKRRISWLRPPELPATREVRCWVDLGSRAYSAVIQPPGIFCICIQRGTPGSMDTLHKTLVFPMLINTDPSG